MKKLNLLQGLFTLLFAVLLSLQPLSAKENANAAYASASETKLSLTANDSEVTIPANMLTSPEKKSQRRVRFAYLADTHISEVASNVEDLEISVRDINSLSDIDFVIVAGDVTEFGSDDEIQLAYDIISKLKVPFYVLSGNHDSKWSESGCNTFAEVFGYEAFSFEFGGVQFIGTNSGPNMRMAPALVPRETMVWLDSVTRVLPKEIPVIFVNHYPLDDAMLNYQQVIDMLRRVNIQFAMCGHGHNNRVMDFSGIPGIMGRSNLRAGRAAAGHAGYNIVDINNGLVTFSVRSNGTTQEPWHTFSLVTFEENSATSASATSASATSASATSTSATSASETSASVTSASATSASVTSASATSASETSASETTISSKTTSATSTSTSTSTSATSTSATSSASALAQELSSAVVLLESTTLQKDRHSQKEASMVKDTPVKVIWEFQDNSDIGSAAAYAFGMVYISNTAGVIRALDAADGSVKWSFATGGKVFSSPEVCEKSGILVVGSTDTYIYGLNAKSGEMIWKTKAQKSVLGSPAIFGDVVYIGASDGVFRALDLKTGGVVWSYPHIRGFIEAKPWVDSQGVYIGDWANRVYAFDLKSGALQWEWTNRRGRGLSAAAVWSVKADGKVFVVTPERRSHAIDAVTGKELWSARGGRESIGLSQDGSAIYIKTMWDTVFAFSTGAYLLPDGTLTSHHSSAATTSTTQASSTQASSTQASTAQASSAQASSAQASTAQASSTQASSNQASSNQASSKTATSTTASTAATSTSTGISAATSAQTATTTGISAQTASTTATSSSDTDSQSKLRKAASEKSTKQSKSIIRKSSTRKSSDNSALANTSRSATTSYSALTVTTTGISTQSATTTGASATTSAQTAPEQPAATFAIPTGNTNATFSQNTPVMLWQSHTGYGYEISPSPMTTADGLLFVPTDKGNIFTLNATDGTVLWNYRFSIALINYIRPIGNRRILVTSMDGKVGVLEYYD